MYGSTSERWDFPIVYAIFVFFYSFFSRSSILYILSVVCVDLTDDHFSEMHFSDENPEDDGLAVIGSRAG